jgi:CRISPR-associated protein Csb2
MAAEAPSAYSDWRGSAVANALADFPIPAGKKSVPRALAKKREAAEAPFPGDIVDCLQKDTEWWKGHRWSQPPGSRRVLYWRRADLLRVGPVQAVRSVAAAPVEMFLLALATPTRLQSALPRLARTLPQAELIHRALVSRVGGGTPVECPEITGRGQNRRPLSGHTHAHILPLDLDGDGCLDHVLLHANMGFGLAAQQAIRTLQRTWTKGGVGELQVALVGYGDIGTLRDMPDPLRNGITQLLGPVGGSCVWESRTPFVPPRFMKPRGNNTIEGQVNAELSSRGLPPAHVEVLPWDEKNRGLRHVVRVRRAPAPPPPVDVGLAVRLTFASPVTGPLSIGYGSHFGLGLFFAATDA